MRAAPKVGGYILLPPGNWDTRFCRIWGSLIRNDGSWKKLPGKYRGMGAPGAMEMTGMSQIIRGRQIWSGELRPGAVLQAWRTVQFFNDVKDGEKPDWLLGHSFVFIGYEFAKSGAISGMRVADNGFHGNKIVPKGYWQFLIGANTIKNQL